MASPGLNYPVRRIASRIHPVVWLAPTYAMFLRTLRNPIYTGAYVFGKTRRSRLDAGIDARACSGSRVMRGAW